MNRKGRWGRTRAILLLAAVFLLATNVSQAKYSGGTGEANDPYRIATPNDLNDIGNHIEDFNKCFVMVNDINLAAYTGEQFNIIGPNSTQPFTGVFDGNNKAIHRFNYNSSGVNLVGLFGKVSGETTVIRDLGLVTPDVNGGTGQGVGPLVGSLSKATVSGCYSKDCRVFGASLVGGLVGMNPSGIISGCYAKGSVEGTDDLGGLVGGNAVDGIILKSSAAVNVSGAGLRNGGLAGGNTGYISGCYAVGSVTGTSSAVGGLAGSNDGDIIDSYATGSVQGEMAVGGLLGSRGSDGTVTACYARGSVAGTQFVGGLVGYSFSSSTVYTKCFWDSDVNPDVNGIGNGEDPNVIAKTTPEMMTCSTFTDAGWDFVGEVVNGPNDIWRMCVDGVSYPLLSWEFTKGDLLCPDGVDLVDFSHLANHWQEPNCAAMNDCDRADLDFSGVIDAGDLKILCEHWLDATSY
ncbi:MAG: GLUG motif-containing protein [Planctomycetota bacterium]|jgi:hypothetical protein